MLLRKQSQWDLRYSLVLNLSSIYLRQMKTEIGQIFHSIMQDIWMLLRKIREKMYVGKYALHFLKWELILRAHFILTARDRMRLISDMLMQLRQQIMI